VDGLCALLAEAQTGNNADGAGDTTGRVQRPDDDGLPGHAAWASSLPPSPQKRQETQEEEEGGRFRFIIGLRLRLRAGVLSRAK